MDNLCYRLSCWETESPLLKVSVRTEMGHGSFSSLLYRITCMYGKVTNACFMAREKGTMNKFRFLLTCSNEQEDDQKYQYLTSKWWWFWQMENTMLFYFKFMTNSFCSHKTNICLSFAHLCLIAVISSTATLCMGIPTSSGTSVHETISVGLGWIRNSWRTCHFILSKGCLLL